MKTILLTGGGTAGHVMPNIAILPELKKNFSSIHYIGSHNGIEKEIILKHKEITYHEITTVKLIRSLTPKNLSIPFKLLKGIKECKLILKEIKPNVIFSKGGFVAVPVTIAAHKLGIPIIAHESDLTLGLANKIVLKKCNVLCCSFEKTLNNCKGKGVFTGSAIRDSLFNGQKQIGFRECGFAKIQPTILVIGGSSGAKRINEVVWECVNDICENYNMIHIVGKNNSNKKIVNKNYKQIEFTNEIENLFALADMVITRAGSNVINEFLSLQKPMLLIPLPKEQSRGDQLLNAEEFIKKGYCHVLQQSNLTHNNLLKEVISLDKNKENLIKNMKTSSIKNGKNNILAQILKYTK